jgi:nucleoside-diphosphate-sugar epimerase
MSDRPASDGRCALVAGALGLVGSRLLASLQAAGWRTIGIARGAAPDDAEAGPAHRHLQLDLSDAAACRRLLAPLAGEVTHVFFAARASDPDPAQETRANLALLTNLLAALDGADSALAHVCLVHGTKWYGSHLGPYPTPAREDDPRCEAPVFYYAQHDEMQRRALGRRWRWSTVRPHIVMGVCTRYPHNCVTLLAAYGSLCKATGRPFAFPGPQAAFDAVSQCTDADLLARAMIWSATDPCAADQDYNVINGDYFRWNRLWPALARFFELPDAPPRSASLQAEFADAQPLWARIVAEHGLQPVRLEQLANWRFGDFLFAATWDDMSSTVKLREHGFQETIATEASVLGHLARMREARLIP